MNQRDVDGADYVPPLRHLAMKRRVFEVVTSSQQGDGEPAESAGREKAESLSPTEEAIVLLKERPSLLITNNRIEIPRTGTWGLLLSSNASVLERCLPSIGRIDVDDGVYAPRELGTGWMVAPGIVATNHHVAKAFARNYGSGRMVFTKNMVGQELSSFLDFEGEANSATKSTQFRVERVLYMRGLAPEDATTPDVALLQLKMDAKLPPPLRLSSDDAKAGQSFLLVGYPAFDDRYGIDSVLAEREIFGELYQVKRAAPGKVMSYDKKQWYFAHEATTLGGNSGSPLLDLTTGTVIGMHFSGTFRAANLAVTVKSMKEILASLDILPRVVPHIPSALFDLEYTDEATAVEELMGRTGFNSTFLGEENEVPLPCVKSSKDLVKYSFHGKTEEILHYTHFSVAMSKERRLCYWSAVNIDGARSQSIRGSRPRWRVDPRIPIEYQVLTECYGHVSAGKFSRGHMTRREDPNWGDEATLANWDTFFVTNCVPQVQSFNAGIWNSLEDYALQNAKKDDMKISVLTGPVFCYNDPKYFGLRVPLVFWKVIVFIHDRTDKMVATGYTLSQSNILPREEFVYGAFQHHQVPIGVIEAKTDISFGFLKDIDPLNTGPTEESMIGPRPLFDFTDIVFTK